MHIIIIIKKMFKNNIGSDAMHISCCKMVKAKEVDIFPLTKNSIKFINHISQLFENPIQIIIKKKKSQLFKLGKVQYMDG
jgi:hypothetical protein